MRFHGRPLLLGPDYVCAGDERFAIPPLDAAADEAAAEGEYAPYAAGTDAHLAMLQLFAAVAHSDVLAAERALQAACPSPNRGPCRPRPACAGPAHDHRPAAETSSRQP